MLSSQLGGYAGEYDFPIAPATTPGAAAAKGAPGPGTAGKRAGEGASGGADDAVPAPSSGGTAASASGHALAPGPAAALGLAKTAVAAPGQLAVVTATGPAGAAPAIIAEGAAASTSGGAPARAPAASPIASLPLAGGIDVHLLAEALQRVRSQGLDALHMPLADLMSLVGVAAASERHSDAVLPEGAAPAESPAAAPEEPADKQLSSPALVDRTALGEMAKARSPRKPRKGANSRVAELFGPPRTAQQKRADRGLPSKEEVGKTRRQRLQSHKGDEDPEARVCCACGETLIVKGLAHHGKKCGFCHAKFIEFGRRFLERGKCGWGDFTNEQREHISEISKAARSMDAPDGHLLRPAHRGGAPGKSKMRVNKE